MKFTKLLNRLIMTMALVMVLIIAYSVADANSKQLDIDSDYYNDTLDTSLTEEQLAWEDWADVEWKETHGELQTPLTVEHEQEIRRMLISNENR